jgi:predicted TIM-barrel fold metal-dependent hydrolase
MIIDCHATIGRHFTGDDVSIESYALEMEKRGIDEAIICPRKPPSYSAADANEFMSGLSGAAGGKRFHKALRIDPWRRESTFSDARRHIVSGDFRAAYMNPWEDSFRCNDERVMYVYKYLEREKIPLIMETGYPWVSHISQLWEISKLHPGLKLLATNAGQLDLSGLSFGNVSAVLGECMNMYLGTSAAVGAEWLKSAAEDWARGRVLFTTSYPMFEPEMERFRIDHGCMSAEAREEIYEKNPLRFLDRN